MPADSLAEMARRACGRHVRGITDIGAAPYSMFRSILLKIDSPDQLYQLEQNCPQIVGEDGEIWLNMIKRDIPNWDLKPHQPSNPKNWHKVYRKLKEDAKREMAAGEDRLKAALNSISSNREQNTAQVIPNNLAPRRPVAKRRPVAYDYSGRTGGGGAHKMTVLEKIRKEGRDASKKMGRPTHELVARSSVVRKAPKAFVEDLKHHQQARPSPARPVMKTNPRMSRPPLHGPTTPQYDMMRDREERLKALKSGRPVGMSADSKMTSSSMSNQPDGHRAIAAGGLSLELLEDDELDGEDELFGETSNTAASSKSSKVASPQPKMLKRKTAPSIFMSSQVPKRRNVEVK